MPLKTRSGISVVVIHLVKCMSKMTVLVALGYTFWSRHLCTRFSYPPNHPVIFFILHQAWETESWGLKARFPQQHHFCKPGLCLGPKLGEWDPPVCGLLCLAMARFVCRDPQWCCGKSSGMRGWGLAGSTQHQNGNKPCQHGMKCWWWGWGYCDLTYLGEPDSTAAVACPYPACGSLPWARCWVIQSNHFYIF